MVLPLYQAILISWKLTRHFPDALAHRATGIANSNVYVDAIHLDTDQSPWVVSVSDATIHRPRGGRLLPSDCESDLRGTFFETYHGLIYAGTLNGGYIPVL